MTNMVEESKIIVGLDVGTSNVKAVIGEMRPDGVVSVRGYGICPSKGVQKGGVVDLEAAVSSITRAIVEAEYISNDLSVLSVSLSISGSHIKQFNETGQASLTSIVKKNDIENAIHLARSVKLPDGLETLHIIPQEYRVDSQGPTKNPLGLAGHRLTAQAHLIACHNDSLRNLKNAVELSKYRIDDIVFSGLASAYSVLTEDEKELGVCLIDIGGGTMDVLVYIRGALWFSKVIPLGGNEVTDFIAQAFSTPREQAEQLKVQYGSAMSPPSHSADKKISISGLGGRAARTITRAQLSENTAYCYQYMFGLVAKELAPLRQELIQKGINPDLIAGFVLTGGGSQIEDIVECAKSVFNAEVRVGNPLNITGLTDYVGKPKYATVLGLLQYSYANSENAGTLDSGGELSTTFWNYAKRVLGWTKKQFID